MRRLLVVLLIAVMGAGCGVGAENDAHPVDLTVTSGVLNRAAGRSPAAADPDAVALSVYLVRDNRLVHVTREAPPAPSHVEAVVTAAIDGPTPPEARAGMWSAIPPGTSVRSSHLQDGLVTIDLSSDLAAIGGRDEILSVAQIVQSLTALPGVDAVLFLLDGAATSVPRADGVLDAGPITAADYADIAGQ